MIKKGVLVCSLLLGMAPIAIADEIKIYTWEEYFSDEVIRQFEQDTGHTVRQIYFESEKLRDEVIASGRGNAYDLFVMDGYTLNVFAGNGLLSKVEFNQLKNSGNIDEKALQACGSYGVPYTWGTMGIGYRESKVTAPITSWKALFDFSDNNKNRVIIPLDDIDTVAVALLALGFEPMTNDESELKLAYQLLSSAKNNLLGFRTAEGYALEKGDKSAMDLAVVYSGETYLIAKETGQDDWVYTVPEEGTLLWYECFAAVKEQPFSDAVIAFLDFIHRPEIAAKNAEDIWYATTNKSALEVADDEYLQDRDLFPPQAVVERSFLYKPVSNAALRQRNRIISVLGKK
ncbi:spermidine/putrescine ABC transporter substrate-binding protein [Vibrio sp. HA2012]|uniref:polyamine ABC transporter substrate-binding protein n=1 Tax=Vibrio sp. HA2012 TaxID=1971595 RepID=UPI000C2B74C3|nr:spermidine/putrescine ABC transporter substrate-binding protein [Vibrio sp. HA2012]PJC86734.1 spermidine/putrescine ABC transporter substrate-binding protein [Vibrio sp. HA2012]